MNTRSIVKAMAAFLVGTVAMTLTNSIALAGPFVPQGPFVAPEPEERIPGPRQVPGKEYSNRFDRSSADNNHAPDNGQVIYWDGAGGTTDTTDFIDVFIPEIDPQVDALANKSDVLFLEVIANNAALLFSTDDDPNIYVESIFGGGGIWACGDPTDPRCLGRNDIDQDGFPEDVDALEVWGPTNPSADLEDRVNQGIGELVIDPIADDANRYSLDQSTGLLPGYRSAVFDSNGNPVFTTSDIAGAIGRPDLENDIDLDAMMMFGMSILFSIDPLDVFDGGEIWEWDGTTPGGATFLNHGGHLWDTTFDVMGTFGTASENVNALEAAAVPEPTSLCP